MILPGAVECKRYHAGGASGGGVRGRRGLREGHRERVRLRGRRRASVPPCDLPGGPSHVAVLPFFLVLICVLGYLVQFDGLIA